MIQVVYNKHFIAAVTDSMEQFSRWVKEHPIPEGMTVENLNFSYPFLAIECNEDEPKFANDAKFVFLPGDYPITSPEGFRAFKNMSPRHTIFKLEENWQGQPNWSDYMGVLDHEHFGEDEEE